MVACGGCIIVRQRKRPVLILDLEPFLKPLDLTGRIHYALFAGEEGVALAAYLDLQVRLSCANGEGIAAGARHLTIFVIIGMDFLFHLGLNSLPWRARLRPFSDTCWLFRI